MIVMLAYTAFAAGWGYLCLRHRHDLLPIQVSYGKTCQLLYYLSYIPQNYVSALFGLVVIEMLANWSKDRFPPPAIEPPI